MGTYLEVALVGVGAARAAVLKLESSVFNAFGLDAPGVGNNMVSPPGKTAS